MARRFLALCLLAPALAGCTSSGPSPAPSGAGAGAGAAAGGAGAASESGPTDRQEFEAAMARSGILPEERATRVTYKDNRSGVTVGLLNEACADLSDYYSEPRRELVYKVVPNLEMGALLQALQKLRFFELAQPLAARVAGARSTLLLERGGQAWTLAWTNQDPPERIQAVQKCAQAVLAMYNATQAYQVIDNPQGAEFFESGRPPARPPSPPSGGRR